MTDREKMTSRERILASIRHREPDRVPVDLGGTPSSGISAIAYSNLKAYLGIAEGHTRVYDVVQQLAQPEEMILDRFGVDVLDIGRALNTEETDWYDITLPQGVPVQFPAWFQPVHQPDGSWDAFAPDGVRIATMPVGATFFDQTYFPYIDGYPADYADLPQEMPKIHWAGLVHSPWDHASEPDFWLQLRQKALALRDSSDRALMIVAGCNLFEWGTFLRRIDNFLMDLVLNPEEVERLLDALMEQHLATLEKVCEAVGDVADILRFGDDLGMDTGPFMAPGIYRKLFKPRHTILCDYVHTHSQMHTFLHSCGSIYRLLPDLIEAGYDIINPVQIGTRDMEPARLKREFGRDITFWGGGCDTRHVLNRGTPEKVKDHVKGLLEIWMPGGGFVFNTVHNILPDVPPKNIVAMFEAISEFNGVPVPATKRTRTEREVISMKRYGQVIGVKAETFDEYVEYHADVWPGILKMIYDCNIRNYSIFHKDGLLFAYFEYVGDDFEADMAKMAADPETQRWWDIMMPMQEPLETRAEGEWWANMNEVFHTD